MAEEPSLADVMGNVAAELARPVCDTGAVLSTVGEYLIRAFGLGLVTVSEHDPRDGSILRLYSSMPGAYQPEGRKPRNETDWTRIVIDEQQTFVANDYARLSRFMFDHAKIRALGLESIVNIPVVVGAR